MMIEPIRIMRDGTEYSVSQTYGAWSIVARRPGEPAWSPHRVGFRSEAAARTAIDEMEEA